MGGRLGGDRGGRLGLHLGAWRNVFSGDGELVTRLVGAVVTGGVAAAIVSYLIARVLPRWLTSSFVDVVRYLDTSPRSYAVRRDIRKGLVEMLQALHASKAPRYDRIVLVAHSLGAYLAYDAIAYLWGLTNARTAHDGKDVPILSGLKELEQAASALPAPEDWQSLAVHNHVDEYQAAQRQLWKGIRAQGNPWLITDFVSVGTPMYFADQLLHGKRGRSFGARIERRELPTCPPHNEENPDNNINGTRCYYSWEKTTWEQEGGQRRRVSRRVLYEGAPFAVVRWTNVYFPAEAGFFGDWFGGPLARLFGPGIRDVKVRGNTLGKPGTTWLRHRRMPGIAHSYYFYSPTTRRPSRSPPPFATEWTSPPASGYRIRRHRIQNPTLVPYRRPHHARSPALWHDRCHMIQAGRRGTRAHPPRNTPAALVLSEVGSR
jgi:hypothetical protein